jgi:hypothetical protein
MNNQEILDILQRVWKYVHFTGTVNELGQAREWVEEDIEKLMDNFKNKETNNGNS